MAQLPPDLTALWSRLREQARATPARALLRTYLDAHMTLTWPIDQATAQYESEAQCQPSPVNIAVSAEQISLFPR